MNFIVVILVVLSAFCHAYWNMVMKKTSGGPLFLWLFTLFTVILYIPFFLFVSKTQTIHFTKETILVCFASMVIHLLYFVFLDKAYNHGDLSIIYPLARGVAPVFTIAIAALFLGESLTRMQFASVGLIVVGTFAISGVRLEKSKGHFVSLSYAVACGFMVASYTLIDKVAVSVMLVSPFVLDFINNTGRLLLLSPFVLKDERALKKVVNQYWKQAVVIAVLSPVSYLLILFAMRSAPVSLIAPLRQISIVIGGVLGIHVLCESRQYAKLAGLLITFFSLVLLSL